MEVAPSQLVMLGVCPLGYGLTFMGVKHGKLSVLELTLCVAVGIWLLWCYLPFTACPP